MRFLSKCRVSEVLGRNHVTSHWARYSLEANELVTTHACKMNNSGVLPQEKMELDLELPSSLVQSDGHLRRSNSAPMINGLRFYSMFETFTQQSSSGHMGRRKVTWLISEFVIPVITPKCSRGKSCVAGEIALQSWTGPTWYNMWLNMCNRLSGVWMIRCWMFSCPPSRSALQVPSSPIRIPSTRLHQIKQVRKGAVMWKCFMV